VGIVSISGSSFLFVNRQVPVMTEMATCIKTTQIGYYRALSLDRGDEKIFPPFVDRTEMFQPIASVICKFTFIFCVVIIENMTRAQTFGVRFDTFSCGNKLVSISGMCTRSSNSEAIFHGFVVDSICRFPLDRYHFFKIPPHRGTMYVLLKNLDICCYVIISRQIV
jgi:hypothetical protein